MTPFNFTLAGLSNGALKPFNGPSIPSHPQVPHLTPATQRTYDPVAPARLIPYRPV